MTGDDQSLQVSEVSGFETKMESMVFIFSQVQFLAVGKNSTSSVYFTTEFYNCIPFI